MDREALYDQYVRDFHGRLHGHKAPETWPAGLRACETPNEHVFEDLSSITLQGRKYKLAVWVCKKCPLAFVEPETK